MRRMSHGVLGALAALGCADPVEQPEARAVTPEDAAAGQRLGELPEPMPLLDQELLARAPIDECVETIGFSGMEPPCEPGTRAKINESLLSEAVRSGDTAWFGTLANAPCLGSAKLFGPLPPFETDDLICEGGAGPSADRLGGPAYGDARPPRVLRLNVTTDELRDVTPDDPLLRSTLGLHGAGAHEGVVLLAGPNIVAGAEAGTNVYAFEARTGRALGSTTLPEYADVRGGIVVQGELYLGARKAGERESGGHVVKWVGDRTDPFRFEVVGELASPPTSLVEHEGRIVVAGGASFGVNEAMGEIPGLFLSPVVGEGGLGRADRGEWRRIFGVESYEPDPVIARATSMGDLASFGGRLFVGTSHVPMYATMNAFTAYGRPDTWSGRLYTAFAAERATAVFVIDDVGAATERVTLLYGEAELPAFDAAEGGWTRKANGLGQEPLYGPSGFGDHHNVATAAWAELDGRLYVTTFDVSSTAGLLAPIFAQEALLDLPEEAVALLEALMGDALPSTAGGDLWRIDGPYQPAVPEDLGGYGNPYNVGTKALVAFEDRGELIAGTTNPFNLRTEEDPGGWELLKLTPMAEDLPTPR